MNGLDERIEEYLRLRRALGYRLDKHERYLRQFAAYLAATGAHTITTDHAVAWAILPGGATDYHAARLAVIRAFLRWLAAFEENVEVPPAQVLPRHVRRAEPYIYTSDQIDALINQALTLPSPLIAATYSTLIGLLACTGIRVGEAIRANIDDLDQGILTIADTKFGKTRLVPLHPTTTAALNDYRHTLDQRLHRPLATPALFASTAGTRLIYKNVHYIFHRLVTDADIGARSARCRPRIHDLRHTFAVNTMTDAYRDGRDAAATLPALSTYLGHSSPASTYWYLHAVPELLTQAARRITPLDTEQVIS